MSDILSHLERVVAPMVSQSDAPFRALCLKYGATAAYTEMLYSDRIVDDPSYLDAFLPKCDYNIEGDILPYSALVVQICGNDPTIMAKAVTIIASSERKIAAIDLNLGCPQDRARDNLFGSFLLDKQHWERVFSCVNACSSVLSSYGIPFLCKIRLIEGHDIIELTTQFCRGLIQNGAKAICIHGRTRGSTKKRRCGPADLAAVAKIAQTLHEEYHDTIPVISNGNISCEDDVTKALRTAHPCRGVMSAEGILANPGLYFSFVTHTEAAVGKQTVEVTALNGFVGDCERKRNNQCANSPCTTRPSLRRLFQEYCILSDEYGRLGGWSGLDHYYTAWYQKTSPTAATDERSLACAIPENAEVLLPSQSQSTLESRQIFIARQHLNWMLGKSGHGRTVRYTYISSNYKKHVHLMSALNDAKDMKALLDIGNSCLPDVFVMHTENRF